jgi:glycosyltransferase involved in cell wall biosynthesis
MRILIVSQYFWPENFKINDFALGMKELGHDVSVLTGKPNYPQGKFYKGYNLFNNRTSNFNGIKIIRAPLITRGKGTGFRLVLNYLSFAFFSSITAYFRIKEKYDVIFVYEPSPITVGIPAIILKEKLGIPIFFWVQDLWPESVEAAGKKLNPILLSIINKLVFKIYQHSDRIFISSKYFSESIREKNVDNSKIIYFPNWTEEIYLAEVSDKIKYSSLMPAGFKIMFAGNIGEAQDFESIIQAAELLKTNKYIHWIILGDGRKKRWLEEEVSRLELNSNFHILGAFPNEEMPNFFYHSDAMLVSLKDSEVFSLTVPAKIQSYLAFGKPIIAMLNGEGALIVEDAKAGLSCSAGNYKMLARNIEFLINSDKAELAKMGKYGKEYYNRNFNRDKILRRFEQIYMEMNL